MYSLTSLHSLIPNKYLYKYYSSSSNGLSKKGIIGIPLSIYHEKLQAELSIKATFSKFLLSILRSLTWIPPDVKMHDSL